MEVMLKFIVSRSSLEGDQSSFKENHQSNIDRVDRRTLGLLLKDFLEIHSTEKLPEDEKEDREEDIDGFWISMAFKIEMGEEDLQQRKDTLASIVEERNNLIHLRLSSLDHNSVQSCKDLSAYLDEQFENLKPVSADIANHAIALKELYLAALDELGRPEED